MGRTRGFCRNHAVIILECKTDIWVATNKKGHRHCPTMEPLHIITRKDQETVRTPVYSAVPNSIPQGSGGCCFLRVQILLDRTVGHAVGEAVKNGETSSSSALSP